MSASHAAAPIAGWASFPRDAYRERRARARRVGAGTGPAIRKSSDGRTADQNRGCRRSGRPRAGRRDGVRDQPAAPDPGAAPDGRADRGPGRALLPSRADSRPSCCRPASARRRWPELERIGPAISALPASASLRSRKRRKRRGCRARSGLPRSGMGEQENCLLNHRATSCIFPIDRGGVHTLQGGARRAIEAFTRRLADEPSQPRRRSGC